MAAAASHTDDELIMAGRRAMEQKFSPRSFSIAGVTFDGRQELVRALQPDQILLLEREPWNPYDPAAVVVVDLAGRNLGYIPKKGDLNKLFARSEAMFGLVGSAGPVMDGTTYGAHLYARPDIASLTLDPLLPPAAGDAARLADLPAVLGGRWAAVRAATLSAANYKCEVTGLGQSQLQQSLVPVWRYNTAQRSVQMVRLMVLCQPLAMVKARLEMTVAAVAAEQPQQGSGDAGSAAAVKSALAALQALPDGQLFTELNGLAEEDALQYLDLVRRRAQTVQADRWRVEMLL